MMPGQQQAQLAAAASAGGPKPVIPNGPSQEEMAQMLNAFEQAVKMFRKMAEVFGYKPGKPEMMGGPAMGGPAAGGQMPMMGQGPMGGMTPGQGGGMEEMFSQLDQI